MSLLPLCVDELGPPFPESALPAPQGLPALPCCLWRGRLLLPARQGKPPASPIPCRCSRWHAMLHALSWLCCHWHPGDAHLSLPWSPAAHSPSTNQFCPFRLLPAPLVLPPLGCHGSVGSPACGPLGAGDSVGGRNTPPPRWHGAERRSGKGVGRQGSPPPSLAAPAPLPGPTIPFITPPPFIGPDRCPQINTPRQ